MKPQKQLHRHRPPTAWGDCFRTSIAIVLDMDAADVPHFMDKGVSGPEGSAAAEAWLNARGIVTLNVLFSAATPLQAILDSLAAVNQSSLPVFLLSGVSRNGCEHVVVAYDGEIVCDPSIDNSGIIGPCRDGYYWVTFFGALQATNSEAKLKRDAASKRDRLDAAASLLCADMMVQGFKRGAFYITIGDDELHVYATEEIVAGAAMGGPFKCDYPIEWHVAKSFPDIADHPHPTPQVLRSEPASADPQADAGSHPSTAEAAE